MFIAFILAFLIGVFSVLLLEAFLLYKWWSSAGVDAQNLYPQRTKVTNPEVFRSFSCLNKITGNIDYNLRSQYNVPIFDRCIQAYDLRIIYTWFYLSDIKLENFER